MIAKAVTDRGVDSRVCRVRCHTARESLLLPDLAGFTSVRYVTEGPWWRMGRQSRLCDSGNDAAWLVGGRDVVRRGDPSHRRLRGGVAVMEIRDSDGVAVVSH